MNPSHDSLSATGFYYTGIYIITISVSMLELLSSSLHTSFYLQVKDNMLSLCRRFKKICVPQKTLGGNSHSGSRIASTFVISREKNSYANVGVVYTRVITLH